MAIWGERTWEKSQQTISKAFVLLRKKVVTVRGNTEGKGESSLASGGERGARNVNIEVDVRV